MSFDQIFVANSSYSLFTYLLMFPNKMDDTLFVVGPALKDIRVPVKMLFDMPDKEATSVEINAMQCSLMHDIRNVLSNKKVPCYGNANSTTNPFIDAFIDTYPFYALSDGLSDYDLFHKYYQDENILKCYSTTDIIKDLKPPKLTTFDVQKLWNGLSEEHQNKIANIFNMSAKDLSTASSRSVVLITQPLSEDNMMAESDKVELYTRIVNNYGVENVVIKPHPREKTNWAQIFPDMPIIPRQIPVELLTKLVSLNKVATFFSTAAFGSVADDKIDFYAQDFAQMKAYHPNKMRVCEQTGEERKSIAVSDIEQTYRPVKSCHWKRISDNDNRFYHADFEIDEAGIPTYMAPKIARKILSAMQAILPNNVNTK